MERLTRKSDSGMVWFIDREHKSGYAEREPCDMDAHHARLAIAKLAEYEDLEEQGKLLKLPVSVGDTVYRVRCETFVERCNILGFAESRTVCYMVYIDPDEKDVIELSDFGKTVFLTRESAEAALKEMSE